MKFPVFDLHCDIAEALVRKAAYSNETLKKNTLHIDLERAKKLPGYGQCFACFTSDLPGIAPDGISPVQMFERELAAIYSEVEKNGDTIRFAYCAEDIRRNLNDGMMSAVLSIEGPAGFGFDPALLEDLYKVGFRITTLGWNEKNPLTGSHITGGGLTELGREYVFEAQRLGMIVDVSHISDEGFWDIVDMTTAPIIASHSNSRSVWNASRNLTDDMFRAICDTGGVAGINLYADFLGKKPDVDCVCKHILHFLEIDTSGKHIALGGDLDGCDALPNGFGGVQDYPLIAQKLSELGICNDTIFNIYWNNAVGVIDKCCI